MVPGHEGESLEERVGSGSSRKFDELFSAGAEPVPHDVEGEDDGEDGVERTVLVVALAQLGAQVETQNGKGVGEHVVELVLCQRLHRRASLHETLAVDEKHQFDADREHQDHHRRRRCVHVVVVQICQRLYRLHYHLRGKCKHHSGKHQHSLSHINFFPSKYSTINFFFWEDFIFFFFGALTRLSNLDFPAG